MFKAFGIVNSSERNIHVEGLQDYRAIGAFSFLGRYRVIDFPISNMSNSGIDVMQVYVRRKPRSLVEHIGTGRHYNINSKRGKLITLFQESNIDNGIYNTDIAAYMENLDCFDEINSEYVVIAPSYMEYTDLLNKIDSNDEVQVVILTGLGKAFIAGADITLMYHSVDNAKDHFPNCQTLNINKQKGVLSMEPNLGNAKNRNIFMDTYVMKKDLFIELIHKARKTSSVYTLLDIVNASCDELDIRGVSHKGYFAFKSYYDSNLSLTDIKTAQNLFDPNWPIYTRTNDSCPTQYFETGNVKNSVVSNGCLIEGSLEHSVVGRGCIIKKGAVIKNCVVLSDAYIGENVHIENQVVDKHAKITHVKELTSSEDRPGYVRRNDTL